MPQLLALRQIAPIPDGPHGRILANNRKVAILGTSATGWHRVTMVGSNNGLDAPPRGRYSRTPGNRPVPRPDRRRAGRVASHDDLSIPILFCDCTACRVRSIETRSSIRQRAAIVALML